MSETKYVVFNLAGERYGIPIESVERILPKQKITRIPRTPKMLLGVFELRGSTLPAIDARLRFEMIENPEAANYIVVLSEDDRLALRVDSVDGIESFDADNVDETQSLALKSEAFITGVGKNGDKLTVLLDPGFLVPENLRAKYQKALAA